MKSIIKKFWKPVLWVFAFFFGTWFFNHYCVWIGIAICVASVILFVESVLKSLIRANNEKVESMMKNSIQINDKKEDEKD
jgi:hypothetical protein